MTICVAARVNDCIVFAADSATTLVDQRGNQILNVYDYGNKVFNLYKGLPVCAMTCGFGNIGRQSISTIAKDLRRRLVSGGPDWAIDRKNYNISDIAEKARKYIFEERYQSWANKPQGPHSLNFYLGGYSSQAEGHELWQITIENGACPNAAQISKDGECGLNWAGQPEPIWPAAGFTDTELRCFDGTGGFKWWEGWRRAPRLLPAPRNLGRGARVF